MKPDAKIQKLCEKLGYTGPEKLIFHFPRRHEDRAIWRDPYEVELGEPVTVIGKVAKQKFARWRGGRSCFEVVLQLDETFQPLQLAWYGISYLQKHLVEGTRLVAHGKVTEARKKGERRIQHPEFEIIKDDEEKPIHLDRITPIYPATEGVSQRAIRREIFHLLEEKKFEFPEIFSAPEDMPLRSEAMRDIHFPKNWDACQRARRRLAFDELFEMQLMLAMRRQFIKRANKERAKKRISLVEKFQKNLSFEMTAAQVRVCGEIDENLLELHPMNRLLQGDVGSGKTLVAAHALLRTLERGENGALLAPTEILAEQHYLNFRKWLEPLGVQVELWTRTRRPLDEDSLFNPNGKIFIGTHALIQERAALPRLGLGVVDEQHKFGVLQRAALQEKGEHPDLLVMTATPIPRTLCLTLYGDLDISVLDEMPAGRGQLRTVLRSAARLPKVWDFIKKEIAEGRQAYVVYPLVEESEKIDLKSVESEAESLRKIFGRKKVEVLHGRMDTATKEDVMKRFREKKFNVLVATTVIEVGVDVPNATVMVIENAERFGLAQLHQLRGRVGRGGHQSFCVLVGQPRSKESWRRLKIMEETSDGFRLAEEDLKIRGPGNVLGTEQSGLPPLRVADLSLDMVLLSEARSLAQRLVREDPALKKWPALKRELKRHFSAGLLPAVN